MPTNKATALAEIDGVLERGSELAKSGDYESLYESIAIVSAAIKRLSPPNSTYLDSMARALEYVYSRVAFAKENGEAQLRSALKGLRSDYDFDRLQSFHELIHADVFSDFLEMAEYFLQEGYKDPAAVMAGGVLEEHLRKLSHKHGIALAAHPKLDTMNADLAKKTAYGKNEQKQVTAWAGIRNDAAHGKFKNYTDAEVKLMVAGIRDFISRNPA